MNELALQHGMPVPLEVLNIDVIPEHLLGHDGVNRAFGVHCQISAQSDLAAIWTWLEEFNQSPSTFRAYRKEIERFYNWLLFACNKPLSSMTREDLTMYEKFLQAPSPDSLWCGKSKARRGTAEWRPFVGPLPPRSRAYSMTVIGALLSYLVDVRYLSGNPLAARRRKGSRQKSNADKVIPLPILQKLIGLLEQRADSLPHLERERATFERMLFVVRFLANTGLRRAELTVVSMKDIYSVYEIETASNHWFMHVFGKGEKNRSIALNESAREALRRYHRFYGLPDQYRGNHNHVLLPLSGRSDAAPSESLTDQMVYNIVHKALQFGATELLTSYPEDATTLCSVTPHWFRHTFATICSQLGHDIHMIKKQLGHESIETTALYLQVRDFELSNAINKLKI